MKFASTAAIALLNANLSADKSAAMCRLYSFYPASGGVLRFTDADFDMTIVLPSPTISSVTQVSPPASTIIPPGTYGWRVSALFGINESQASPEVQLVVTGSHAALIQWPAVGGATGYRVYGRTVSGELLIATVGPYATSYTDDASITPAGALPVGFQIYSSSGPAITRGAMRHPVGTELSTLDVTLGGITPIGPYASPVQAALAGYFDGAAVQVDKLFQNFPGDKSIAPIPWFVGLVGEPNPRSSSVDLTIESCTSLLATTKWPNRLMLAQCPYSVYEPRCGATKYPQAVVVQAGSGTLAVTVSGLAHGSFVLGQITMANGEIRQISSMVTSGANDVLNLNYPLNVAPTGGAAASVIAGCDKSFAGGGTAGALNCQTIGLGGATIASFTASVITYTFGGSSLVVTAVASGTLNPYDAIYLPASAGGACIGFISSLGGSGGTGSYFITNPSGLVIGSNAGFTSKKSNIGRYGGFPWVPRPESVR